MDVSVEWGRRDERWCSRLWGGSLLRAVLRPAFLPERKPECDGGDRDRGVGHIEGGPAPGAEAEVDEVDDALRAANPVDEIADGAATDERQRHQPEAIAGSGTAYERREHHQRHDRESEKDPAGGVAEM